MRHDCPPTLETEECEKLLDTLLTCWTTPNKKRKAIRNHCMALLMLDAGLRVGELVSLRLSDLYFNMEPVRTIFIKSHMTKNKVEHSIPVSQRLSLSLSKYAETLTSQSLDPNFSTQFAFLSGKWVITTRQVERIICAAGMKALGRPVHPHVLRHTFATKLMRVTNINTVQQILGHKYLSSTQVYCHPSADDKRQAIELASLPSKQDESLEVPQKEQLPSVEPELPGPRPASPSAPPPASRW